MGGFDRQGLRRSWARGRVAAMLGLLALAFAPAADAVMWGAIPTPVSSTMAMRTPPPASFMGSFEPLPATTPAPAAAMAEAASQAVATLGGSKWDPAYSVHAGTGLALQDWRSVARRFKGVAVNVAPTDGLFDGQQVRLFGGESGRSHTAGMSWRSGFGRDGQLGAGLLYIGRPGTNKKEPTGQWVTRLGAGIGLPGPLAATGLRLEGELATMPSANAVGAIVRLTRPANGGSGLSYGLEFRRLGERFNPLGATGVAGREAFEAHVDYRFSSGMRFGVRSLLAAWNFHSPNPLWVQEVGLRLAGSTLNTPFGRAALDLQAFFREREDRWGNRHLRTRGFDLRLQQFLAFGWRTRIGLGMTWEDNLVAETSKLHRRVSVGGRHAVNLGPFLGLIGPGVAWRRSTGAEVCTKLEAGLALELVERSYSLGLNMGFLRYENELDSAPPEASWHTMLSYRMQFGGRLANTGNGWYDLLLGLF